jgi:hypothetical protein
MQLLLELYGKGTRVFAVKEMDTKKHAVIKDCWDPSEAISDYLVHSKLQDPGRIRAKMFEGHRFVLASEPHQQTTGFGYKIPTSLQVRQPHSGAVHRVTVWHSGTQSHSAAQQHSGQALQTHRVDTIQSKGNYNI